MRFIRPHALATIAMLGMTSCGEGGESESGTTEGMEPSPVDATAPESDRRVEIVEPADGDTIQGPQVTVRLEAYGFTVVPAGDTTANSGHHHFFLDRDVTPMDEVIPSEVGSVVHMGDGSSTYVLENVPPGEHRLIAVVGDAIHVPVQPPLMDTVHFVVR